MEDARTIHTSAAQLTFGDLLKQLRRQAYMTQRDLALATGYSIGQICRFEQNQRVPDLPTLTARFVPALAQHTDAATTERLLALAHAAHMARRGGQHHAHPASLPHLEHGGRHDPGPSLPALPIPATPLLGREHEVARVCALLRQAAVRLLTLTGAPGIGKTRLGLQVAAELHADFADGVAFAALAPISDPALVITSIAQALGIQERAGQTLLDSLKSFLRQKRLLLLLDNFEQVIVAALQIGELLAAAPRLKVLVTSRMRLRLSGEREFAVAPLGLPPRGNAPQPIASTAGGRTTENRTLDRVVAAVADLTQYAAVQLFIERAQAVKADFALTNANAPAVAEICLRLDGLPLAIELAAARIKLFAPAALLRRLERRLPLLTGGSRDLPARQQTLRTTLDWSYDLLDEEEKTLFARLGVFVGGCTLEAAEAICTAVGDLRSDILKQLTGLVDQTLVQQEEGLDGEPRFVLLETIREYALERLAERGEADTIRQQHATYFLKFAEQYDPWPRLHAPPQQYWLARVDAEHDNLRVASRWFAEQGQAEYGVRLAGALLGFWADHFYWDEGRAWLEAALARSGNVSVVARAKAAFGTSWLAGRLGDVITACASVEEALALFRGLSDKPAIALAILQLGTIVLGKGDYVIAQACAEECLALFQDVSDQWGRALALQQLGHIAAVQGDLVQAAIYNEEILTFFRQIGDKRGMAEFLAEKGYLAWVQGEWEQAVACSVESLVIFRELGAKEMTAVVLCNLGDAVLHQGDDRQAARCFAEGLALSQEIESRYGIATNLAGMADVAATQGRPERSARLLGSAEALLEEIGIVLNPANRADYNRIRTAARAQLDDATFAAAWAAGQRMSLNQAIAEALDTNAEC